MKFKAWPLLLVACGVFGAAWSSSAGDRVLFHHFQFESFTAFSCAHNPAPGFFHLADCALASSGQVQDPPRNQKKVAILQALNQQPEDGQAGDDSSNDTDFALAFSEPCHSPTEWRLIRSDTQLSNSFIHSKFKPPP